MRSLGLDTSSVALSVIAFTPYAALTAPLPVLLGLLLRRWIPTGIAFGALVLLAAAVLPRAWTDGDQTPIRRGVALTVMSLNMDDGGADPATIVRLVRENRVDVLSLVELKSSLPGLDRAGLQRYLPQRLISPRSPGGGSALLADVSMRQLSPAGAGYLLPAPTGAMRLGGRSVHITVSHPPHPTSEKQERTWLAGLRGLPSAPPSGPFQLVLGDLNATLDHHELRRVISRGYLDAADAAGAGLVTTWPTRGRRVPGIAIDHVLVDRRTHVRAFRAFTVPGTDHRAILADITVPLRKG